MLAGPCLSPPHGWEAPHLSRCLGPGWVQPWQGVAANGHLSTQEGLREPRSLKGGTDGHGISERASAGRQEALGVAWWRGPYVHCYRTTQACRIPRQQQRGALPPPPRPGRGGWGACGVLRTRLGGVGLELWTLRLPPAGPLHLPRVSGLSESPRLGSGAGRVGLEVHGGSPVAADVSEDAEPFLPGRDVLQGRVSPI